MASSYTTSLKIQEIGNGEQSGIWGSTTNTNWTLAEQAIAGVQTITMANTNYTLSNLNGLLDEARNMVLVVTGTNSGVYQVVAPLVSKVYIVTNNTAGGFAITIGGASGSVINIPNGVTAQVYCDGVNFYSAQTGSAGNFTVNGTLSATGVTDTGSLSAGSLTVSGTTALNGAATAPTATAGNNSTNIATTAFVQTALAGATATISGTILMWPTATAPSGYLLCNGQAVSRVTYSALFALFATTFGAGDGSTTFNLPNYTNNFPVGAGGSYAVASTGGFTDATLPAHTHTATVTDPGHSHSINPPYYGSSYPNGFAGGGGAGQVYSTTQTAVTGISVTNSATGVSPSGMNLPPYLAMYFIIKT